MGRGCIFQMVVVLIAIGMKNSVSVGDQEDERRVLHYLEDEGGDLEYFREDEGYVETENESYLRNWQQEKDLRRKRSSKVRGKGNRNKQGRKGNPVKERRRDNFPNKRRPGEGKNRGRGGGPKQGKWKNRPRHKKGWNKQNNQSERKRDPRRKKRKGKEVDGVEDSRRRFLKRKKEEEMKENGNKKEKNKRKQAERKRVRKSKKKENRDNDSVESSKKDKERNRDRLNKEGNVKGVKRRLRHTNNNKDGIRRKVKKTNQDAEERTGARTEIRKKDKKKKDKKKKDKKKKKKKIQKVTVILGQGGTKAVASGKCAINGIISSVDGNSAVFYGKNIEKSGACKLKFKAPSGSTLTVNCPSFNLGKGGCNKESVTLNDKTKKSNKKYCATPGPLGWGSTGNHVEVTHERKSEKKKKKNKRCSKDLVCQVSITGTKPTDKLIGLKEDCGKKFHLESGESAVVFSANGHWERLCTHTIMGPLGTILNISCPLIGFPDKGYCEEELSIKDDKKYFASLCSGEKLDVRSTLTHIAIFEHDREKHNKGYCTDGFACKVTVIDWWNTAQPTKNYNPRGYTFRDVYPYPNSACPSRTSLSVDYPKCEFTCLKDEDCPPLHYCCPNGCGRLCVPPEVTNTDDCGCSLAFLWNWRWDHNSPSRFARSFLHSFIWGCLNESFTPSIEPYIIDEDFMDSRLGPFDSLCDLRKALQNDKFVEQENFYNVYKKPTRKLFIITSREKKLEEISFAALKDTYSTICLITIGSVNASANLLNQLTLNSDGNPCAWSVDTYNNLEDILPSVKAIINDGSCLCPGDSVPTGPCIDEGGACTRNDECNEPKYICNQGICKEQNCNQLDSIDPEPDYGRHFHSSYYSDYYDDSFYEGNVGYYHDYDYFYSNHAKPPRKVTLKNSEGPERWYREGDLEIDRLSEVLHKLLDWDNDPVEEKEEVPVPGKRSYSYYSAIIIHSKGCCGWNHFECSGVPAVCLIDIKVCDGKSDCIHGDDESPEACAKRKCGKGWFQCSSGECIGQQQQCDGVVDCPDGSDENCQGQSDCPSYRQHFCSTGECISHYQICDSTVQCKSGEDELSCRCKKFKCASGECIDKSNVCDGYNHCSDRSDELCQLSNISCPHDREFKCSDGRCIEKYYVCDGYEDCPDGGDESTELCFPEKCKYCPSGKCLSDTSICDGFSDCEDGSDETNCKSFTCSEGKFHCRSGECLDITVMCNGREECADGSDENSCYNKACFDSRPLHCSSGECIRHSQVCNGVFDCRDKSDESKCLNLPCPQNRKHKCPSGQCLAHKIIKCNNFNNCLDGSDEINCPECAFKCRSGECLSKNMLCNGKINCPDGSDEEDCEGIPCSDKADFRCNSGECIWSYYYRCNGHKECFDGSDELNCEDYTCPKDLKYKCTSGQCLAKSNACNGVINCEDGSDEKDCQPKPKCGSDRIPCKSGGCEKKHKFCDGYINCLDGSDEDDCQSFTCPAYRPFHCKSGECRRASQRCDGFTSCTDGSDEEDCDNFSCPPIRPFSCSSGICITIYQVCNGYDDCGDGSDEKDCDSFKCPNTTFQCKTGQCIPLRYLCDKDRDCPDGEDELSC